MNKVCPKCRAINDENASKCHNCGYVFTEDENAIFAQTLREPAPEHSRTFRLIAIAVAVVSVILGIICGATDQTISSTRMDTAFNVGMMLIVWLAGIVSAILLWAISCHLKNQEDQIQLLQELVDKEGN